MRSAVNVNTRHKGGAAWKINPCAANLANQSSISSGNHHPIPKRTVQILVDIGAIRWVSEGIGSRDGRLVTFRHLPCGEYS